MATAVPATRYRIKKLTIDRVDLVPLGANLDLDTGDGAHVMLYKAVEDPIGIVKATDPGFFRHCMRSIAPKSKAGNPEAFCAWLHQRVTGIWPGEHGGASKSALDDLDDATIEKMIGEYDTAIEKKIRRNGDEYEVTTEDGSKVLGRHKTRADAERQLAAIEASKRRKALDAIGDAIEKFAPVVKMEHEAHTFAETLAHRHAMEATGKLSELVWAFMDAANSILASDEPDRTGMLRESATDFIAALFAALPDVEEIVEASAYYKGGRKISAARLKTLREMHERLGALIADATPAEGAENMTDTSKGGTAVADVQKQVDDAVTKAVADLRKDNERLTADLQKARDETKAERDARLQKEMAEIVKAEFAGVPGVKDEDVAVFKTLSEKAPDEWKRTREILKGAAGAIKAATDLTKEIGHSGAGAAGADGAEAEIYKVADQMVTDKKAADRAAAISKMSGEPQHAGLFRRYDAEREAARRR